MDCEHIIEEKLSWVCSIINSRLSVDIRYTIHDGFYDLHLSNFKVRFVLNSRFWLGEIVSNFTNSSVPHWLGEQLTNIICLGKPNLDTDILSRVDSNNLEFHIDLCGQIYWVLARVEEQNSDQSQLDDLGRFISTSSSFEDKSIYDRPVVDEWIELLRASLKHLGIVRQISDYKIEITHDLDRLSRYKYCSYFKLTTRVARDWFKVPTKAIFNALVNRMFSFKYVSKFDPYNTIEDLLLLPNLGKKITQRFYLIVGKSGHFTDVDYEVHDPGVSSLTKRIKSKSSIGLHNSFHGINNHEILKKELDAYKDFFGEYPSYCRAHYLSFSFQKMLENVYNLGIKLEDHSMCFADRYGFRCGTSIAYEAFDHANNRRVSNLIIQPLIAMQWSAVSKNYMNVSLENSFIELQTYCNRVKLHGGVFTYLIHNDEYYEMGKSYRELLKNFLIENGK